MTTAYGKKLGTIFGWYLTLYWQKDRPRKPTVKFWEPSLRYVTVWLGSYKLTILGIKDERSAG